ncbi:MAG: hypothetical protein ABSC72_11710 [Methylovirgula sp.]
MAKATNQKIPPEAAEIMKRMVSMPPKPHEDMKLGQDKPKGGESPKSGAAKSKKNKGTK